MKTFKEELVGYFNSLPNVKVQFLNLYSDSCIVKYVKDTLTINIPTKLGKLETIEALLSVFDDPTFSEYSQMHRNINRLTQKTYFSLNLPWQVKVHRTTLYNEICKFQYRLQNLFGNQVVRV